MNWLRQRRERRLDELGKRIETLTTLIDNVEPGSQEQERLRHRRAQTWDSRNRLLTKLRKE